jgi:hypothetical protein
MGVLGMIVLIIVVIICGFVIGGTLVIVSIKHWKGHESHTILQDRIDALPGNILKVVQGSINPRKGKIGELLTFLEIKREYDIIIPLGQPIDFIGIGTDRIDFIEVKTGNSRLTDNEKNIKRIIESGNVGFKCVRYDIDTTDTGIQIESSDK